MDVNKSQNNAIGRSIQLEEIFFRVDSEVNEWEYLLTVLGITENDFYDIDSVTIKVDNLIIDVLKQNDIPYFYYTQVPLSDTPFNFIKKALDLRYIDQKVQMYIRHKAKLNIGNQCGVLDSLTRHSKVYTIQRQFPVGSNFVRGEIYL